MPNNRDSRIEWERFKHQKKLIINESKTPLAFVHAGALRRIFLHYQAVLEARKRGFVVEFMLGNDDYDPYDYFPSYFSNNDRDFYSKYLGHPIAAVPAPRGNGSYADYHFSHLISHLQQHFGIHVQTYKTSHLYKSGAFDDYICLVLENIVEINEIYFCVTGRKDKFSKCPIQVICPQCGNMRTTHLTQIKSERVHIVCCDKLLKGVHFTGCGYEGWVNPYQGRSRLVWKLEWPMRWRIMSIDIEGGRKDQNTNKGAREFAEMLYQHFFGGSAPYNIAYDFCYLKSATLPEVNRFGVSVDVLLQVMPAIMIYSVLTKINPSQPINIDLGGEEMYVWYKRYLTEMGHKDSEKVFLDTLDAARYEAQPLSQDPVISNLQTKLRYYLQHSQLAQNWYFDKESVNTASLATKHADWLEDVSASWLSLPEWDEKVLQRILYEAWKRHGVAVTDGCVVLYNLLINRNCGPRAGLLLTKIGRGNFVEVVENIERQKIEIRI